jgi:hypothetical protein
MNTVDNPKTLKDGECVELVNAYPGYPVVPRRGCKVSQLPDSWYPNMGIVPGTLFSFDFDGEEYFLVWMADYSIPNQLLVNLFCVRSDGSLAGVGGLHESTAIKQDGGRVVSYARVGDSVFVSAGDRLWQVEPSRHIDTHGLNVRILQIPTIGSDLPEVGVETSRVHGNSPDQWAYGYSFTFVRNKQGSLYNSVSEVFTPVEIEVEVPGTSGASVWSLVDGGVNGRPRLTFNFPSLVGGVFVNPFSFTHIRVYRTLNQAEAINGMDLNASRWLPGVSAMTTITLPVLSWLRSMTFRRDANGVAHFRQRDKEEYTQWITQAHGGNRPDYLAFFNGHFGNGYLFSDNNEWSELRNPDMDLGDSRWLPGVSPETVFTISGSPVPVPGLNSLVGRSDSSGILWFKAGDFNRYMPWLENAGNWAWLASGPNAHLNNYAFSIDNEWSELRNPDEEANRSLIRDVLNGSTRFFLIDIPFSVHTSPTILMMGYLL